MESIQDGEFIIRYKPHSTTATEQGTLALNKADLEDGHPDIAMHTRYLSLLAVQSNQISGINCEDMEYDLASDYDIDQRDICGTCHGLSTTKVPEGYNPMIRGFLTTFEASAAEGCEICSLILEAIAPCTGLGRVKAYVNNGLALNIIVKSENKNARYELFTMMGERPSPWPAIGQARKIAESSTEPQVIELLKTWIQDCQGHEVCRSITEESFSPTRLIHIHDDYVHIEEPMLPRTKYIALSHCWGSYEILKTTKGNLGSLMRRIEWTALSKTFQDVIELCRKLGVRYVWIDSLCIVQDDDRDWEREALNMAQIYEHAFVVVSAAAARDGSVGLFGPRKPVQILASNDTETTMTVRTTGSQYRYIVRPSPEESDQEIKYVVRDMARHAQWDPRENMALISGDFNPLNSRAWAFQERLLATRIVHFADHEMIWECHEGQRCECTQLDGHDSRPYLERDTLEVKQRFSEITRTSDTHASPFFTWANVIELYNQRALTFEKDRLPALVGAAAKMQNTKTGTYVAGLFLGEFPRCLLWKVPGPGVRQDDYYAPTWSWASVIMPSGNPNRATYPWTYYTPYTPTTRGYKYAVVESFVSLLGLRYVDEPERGPKVAALHVRGRLMRVSFSFKLSDKPAMTTEVMADAIYFNEPLRTFRYFVSRDNKKAYFESDLILHEGRHQLEENSDLFLLAVGRSAISRHPDLFIVLKRLEKPNDFEIFASIHSADANLVDTAFARIGSFLLKAPDEEEVDPDCLDWLEEAEEQELTLF